jgi:hypothetical protein
MKIIIIIITILLIIILFSIHINNKKIKEHLVNNSNINTLLQKCGEGNEKIFSNVNVLNKLILNNNEFTNLVFEYAFPVGSFYVQFPEKNKSLNDYSSFDENAFPVEQRPETLFGGFWQEQWPNESIYFRTRGMLSNQDRDERGFQDYATKHLYGSMSQSQTDYLKPASGNSGVFKSTKIEEISTDGGSNDMHGMQNYFNLESQVLPSDMENRVKNRKVKIWKRVLKLPNGNYPPLPDYGHPSSIDKNYYDGPFYKKAFENYKPIDATTLDKAIKICNENTNCKFVGKRDDLWYISESAEMIQGTDTTVVWEKKRGDIKFTIDIPNITYNIPESEEQIYQNDEDRPEGWYIESGEGQKTVKEGSEGWMTSTE